MRLLRHPGLLLLLFACLFCSGCISAWMAQGSGRKISFAQGTPRAEVLKVLGEPVRTLPCEAGRAPRFVESFDGKKARWSEAVRYEVFEYTGKINAVDEGGGQATVNALTLGLAEVVMIPMTAADIAARAGKKHVIHVYFDAKDRAVRYVIDPKS